MVEFRTSLLISLVVAISCFSTTSHLQVCARVSWRKFCATEFCGKAMTIAARFISRKQRLKRHVAGIPVGKFRSREKSCFSRIRPLHGTRSEPSLQRNSAEKPKTAPYDFHK